MKNVRKIVLLAILLNLKFAIHSQNVLVKHIDFVASPTRGYSGTEVVDIAGTSAGVNHILGKQLVLKPNNVIAKASFINCLDKNFIAVWSRNIENTEFNTIELVDNSALVTAGKYLRSNAPNQYCLAITMANNVGNWVNTYNDQGECLSAKESFSNGVSDGIISCGFVEISNKKQIQVTKVNKLNGSIIWSRIYSFEHNQEIAYDVCQDELGNYILPVKVDDQIGVLKLDLNGNILNHRLFNVGIKNYYPKRIISKKINNQEQFIIVGNNYLNGISLSGFLWKFRFGVASPIIDIDAGGVNQFLEITDLKNDDGNHVSISSKLINSSGAPSILSILSKINLTNLVFTTSQKFNLLTIKAFENISKNNYFFPTNMAAYNDYDVYKLGIDFNGGQCAGQGKNIFFNEFEPILNGSTASYSNFSYINIPNPNREIFNLNITPICSTVATTNSYISLSYCELKSCFWFEPCNYMYGSFKKYVLSGLPNTPTSGYSYDSEIGFISNNTVIKGCIAHCLIEGDYEFVFYDEDGNPIKKLNVHISKTSVSYGGPCESQYLYCEFNPGFLYTPEYGSNDADIEFEISGNGINTNGNLPTNPILLTEGRYEITYKDNKNCIIQKCTLYINKQQAETLPPEELTLTTCDQNGCVWYEPTLPFSTNWYKMLNPAPYDYEGERIAHCLLPGDYSFEFYDKISCKKMIRVVHVIYIPPTEKICNLGNVYVECDKFYFGNLAYQLALLNLQANCNCTGTAIGWLDENDQMNDDIGNRAYKITHSNPKTFRKVFYDPATCTRCIVIFRLICEGDQTPVQLMLGNSKNTNKIEYKLIPNPIDNNFKISFGNADYAQIQIVSQTGITVKTIVNYRKEDAINISNLSRGIYFVTITQNNQKQTLKLIKN